MKFLGKTKAAFLYGKAIKSFLNNNHKNAIALFKRIMELNPDDQDIRFTHYYLGRSYFALKKNAEAKEQMAIAYNLFSQQIANGSNEKDVEYFKTLTKEYIQLLRNIGERKMADKINLERKTIRRT